MPDLNDAPRPTRRAALQWAVGAAGAVALASAHETKPSEARFLIAHQAFKHQQARVGYIDASGKVRIRPTWLKGGAFSEGFAAVCDERGWTWIDAAGDTLVQGRFADARPFSDGLAFANHPRKAGEPNRGVFIDAQGKTVFEVERYFHVSNFSSGRCLLNLGQGRGFGFVDKKGTAATGFDFADADDFAEGLASVRTVAPDGSSLWGVVDVHGAYVIAPRFSRIEPYSEGLAVAGEGRKAGFIDRRGSFVIAPRFARVGPFRNGLAEASMDMRIRERHGYIDRTGDWAIPPQFSEARPFSCGRAFVRSEEGEGFIDPQGARVVPLEDMGWVDCYQNGLALVMRRSVEDPHLRLDYRYIDLAGTTVYSWTTFKPLSKK